VCRDYLNETKDLVLCAGSDKSLEVFDMNVGQTARIIPNVHSRVAHVVKQNEVRLNKYFELQQNRCTVS
jgi:hypothetical protein